MMYKLSASKRCTLFKKIADHVWQEVIAHHSVGVNPSEVGLTKEIITTIRANSQNIPNFGVWANPSYNENQFGGDIDIFVETTPNSFIWYALQAKALKLNLHYEGLYVPNVVNQQWDNLLELSRNAGCKSMYLLYNGVKTYTYNGTDRCRNNFAESQFGCSLVNVTDMISQYNLGRDSFYDFHPDLAQPWRVIVCCKEDRDGIILYDTSLIRDAVDYYPESVGGAVDSIIKSERRSNVDVNTIDFLSNQVNRTPYYRVVIRTNQGLANRP